MKDIDRKTESKEFNEEGKKRRWTIFFFSSVAVVSVWMILIQFDGCMGDSLNWTSFRVVDIVVWYLVLNILYWIFVYRSFPPSNWRSFNVLPALFILPHKKTPFNVNYLNGTFSSFLIFLFTFFRKNWFLLKKSRFRCTNRIFEKKMTLFIEMNKWPVLCGCPLNVFNLKVLPLMIRAQSGISIAACINGWR